MTSANMLDGVVAGFANQVDALVITKPEDEKFRSTCLGCGWRSYQARDWEAKSLANKHAADCRALPRRQEDASHALILQVDLVGTLTSIRRTLGHLADRQQDLAEVTKAVQELTATVTKSTEPLADIANAVSDVANLGDGIADVATAVESLVSSLDEPRRRFRFGRSSAKGVRA